MCFGCGSNETLMSVEVFAVEVAAEIPKQDLLLIAVLKGTTNNDAVLIDNLQFEKGSLVYEKFIGDSYDRELKTFKGKMLFSVNNRKHLEESNFTILKSKFIN